MSRQKVTRRDVIRGGAAASGAVALGSLAGCLDSVPFVGGGGGVPDPSSTVPESAEAMVTMDFAGMINDGDMKEMGNTLLGRLSEAEGYTGPETVDAALDEIQNEAGLDPRGMQGGTAFMKIDGATATEEYSAMVISTDWSESDLVSTLEDQGSSFEQGSYAGSTIYDPEGTTGSILGVLGEGRFALGTRAAVEDAIDVSAGNVDSISGDLVTDFESATDGYMKFGSIIPESDIPSDGGEMQIDGLSELEGISGSLYKSGGNFGFEINMHTATGQAASDLSESLDDLTGVASMAVDNPTALTAIERIQFSTSGSTASVVYEETIANVKEYVEQYADQLVGAGFGGGMPLGVGTGNSSGASDRAPQVSVGFEYASGSESTLTITHQAGNTVRAQRLVIRGSNLGGNTGRWTQLGGSTSTQLDGDPAVAAGDRVELTGVPSDYDARLVYRGPDSSRILATDVGPDA